MLDSMTLLHKRLTFTTSASVSNVNVYCPDVESRQVGVKTRIRPPQMAREESLGHPDRNYLRPDRVAHA